MHQQVAGVRMVRGIGLAIVLAGCGGRTSALLLERASANFLANSASNFCTLGPSETQLRANASLRYRRPDSPTSI